MYMYMLNSIIERMLLKRISFFSEIKGLKSTNRPECLGKIILSGWLSYVVLFILQCVKFDDFIRFSMLKNPTYKNALNGLKLQ